MLYRNGAFFTGMVKTAHREFPRDFIQKHAFDSNSRRGDTVTLTAVKDGCRIIAHGWNEPGKEGKPRKALVSTCGVTTAADPSRRKRSILNPQTGVMEDRVMEVPQTSLVRDYFNGAQGIDVFNHQRQGGLHLEGLNTRDCWFRVFEAMLGTIETSSFNAYRYFEAGKEGVEHPEFTDELACALTGFEPLGDSEAGSSSGNKRKVSRQTSRDINIKHTILKLANTTYFKKKARVANKEDRRAVAHNRCNICGHLCHFYCRECSAVGGTRFMNLCGPTGGRQCISMHIHQKLLGQEDEDE
jgi:hypothetical protein